jgi:hypothetical protein
MSEPTLRIEVFGGHVHHHGVELERTETERLRAGEGASDYVAVGSTGKIVGGPYKYYDEARREADKHGGIVKFAGESPLDTISSGIQTIQSLKGGGSSDGAADFPSIESALEQAEKDGARYWAYVLEVPYAMWPTKDAGVFIARRIFYASGKYHIERRGEPVEIEVAKGPPSHWKPFKGGARRAAAPRAADHVRETKEASRAPAYAKDTRPTERYRGWKLFAVKSKDGKFWVGSAFGKTGGRDGWLVTRREQPDQSSALAALRADIDWLREHEKRRASRASETVPVAHETKRPARGATRARRAAPAGSPPTVPYIHCTRNEAQFRAALAASKKMRPVKNAKDAYAVLWPILGKEDQEVFGVLMFDVRNQCIGWHEVARGPRDHVEVPVGRIFSPVVQYAPHHYLVVHNHPSSKADPSPSDRRLTREIEEGARPFSRESAFVDHVVLGVDECYSFKEKKLYRLTKKGWTP